MQHPGHTLYTARLTLRPVADKDAPAISDALADFEVVRWLSRAPHPYGLRDAEAFVDKNKTAPGRVWMIHDAKGLIGCIGRQAEFGYWLTRPAWGQGFATEAAQAVLDFHFSDPAAEGLLSGHHVGNDRSANVLRKLGFTPCADRVVFAQAVGRDMTIKGMQMDRARYLARRTRKGRAIQ